MKKKEKNIRKKKQNNLKGSLRNVTGEKTMMMHFYTAIIKSLSPSSLLHHHLGKGQNSVYYSKLIQLSQNTDSYQQQSAIPPIS